MSLKVDLTAAGSSTDYKLLYWSGFVMYAEVIGVFSMSHSSGSKLFLLR